jgi:hypothetical protein
MTPSADVVALIAAGGAILAAGGVFWQAQMARHARESEVLLKVYEMLQDEGRRHLRRRFYREVEPRTFMVDAAPLSQDDKDLIDEVTHPYQLIGLMVSHRFIHVSRIYHWRHSINRVWRVARPVIEERRIREGNPDLMSEFEVLAALCRKGDPGFDQWLEKRKTEEP